MVAARARLALWLAVVVTGLACSGAISVYLADAPSRRTIAQWEQPILPQDGSRRLQVVVEQGDWDWNPFPLRNRSYMLYAGREYPYGFWGQFPFFYRLEDAAQQIAASDVDWTSDAAVFTAATGERLVIPYSAMGEKPPSN